MKLELRNNKVLKDCFEAVNTIIDEVVLECDSEGVRLRALDRSHISFVEMNLDNSLFDDFRVEVPEKICVDSTELNRVLKRCKKDDLLYMHTEEGKLVLRFEGDSTRTFKLALIDTEYEAPQLPSLNIPVELTVPTNVLEDFLKDMQLFGETVVFIVDEDYLKCVSGNDVGDSEVKYVHGENVNEVVRSRFSIPKLLDMLKAKNLAKNVTLQLGDDMPLILRFDIMESSLKFMLAPRLDETE